MLPNYLKEQHLPLIYLLFWFILYIMRTSYWYKLLFIIFGILAHTVGDAETVSKLFRQQALDYQSNRLFGEVILIRPLSFALLTTALAVMVVAVLIFLLYGKYGRRETVSGHLLPDKGLVNVYAPYLGIAEQMYIREGQQVKKGEVLYHVSTDFLMSEHFSNNEKLLQHLAEQNTNLKQKISLEKTRFQNEEITLTNQEKHLSAEITQIKLQIETANQELTLAKNCGKNISACVKAP